MPALPECAATLLKVVAEGTTSSEDISLRICRDPILFLEILTTAPLGRDERSTPLKAVERRIAELDPGLLQAWFLRHAVPAPGQRTSIGYLRNLSLHSQLVAELAFHLARETAYPTPEDAYVAGLLHDVGQLWLAEHQEGYVTMRAALSDEKALSAAEWERYGADHSTISAELAHQCGLGALVADAILLHQTSPVQLRSAHLLVRLIAAAEELASYRQTQSALSLDIASHLAGLDGSVLVSLLAETGPQVNDAASDFGVAIEPAMLALPWALGPDVAPAPEAGTTGISRAALNAFARGTFASAEEARNGLARAARLLLGLDAPALFVRSDNGLALVGCASATHPSLDQMCVTLADDTSAIAEAARSNAETRYRCDERPPGRSAIDWQVSRWLGSDGMLCVPWKNHHDAGVAVFAFASADSDPPDSTRALRRDLVLSATLRLSEERASQHLRDDLEQTISRRYAEHARRLAHEASNPLTVIKTYLGIIDERIEDAAIREQLGVLNDELDRIGNLVRRAPDFREPAADGPAQSGVTEILHDLRALYGDALFARRGIQFEVRTTPDLPSAAIAPDALKQVLVNLFKNAAEAIPEGGKLVVTVGTGINANGTSCLEIRVVDNGPGLPPGRIETLFAPVPGGAGRTEGGIGLPVVRDLITAHGGTVLCRSQLGSGTVFQIFIPLAGTP